MKSLFVTGTDTDVGKTCVAAGIVKNLRDMDVDVAVMKPFASGYKENIDSVSNDVEILMKYSGSSDPVNLVNPYYFEIPSSPYDASKTLNIEIDITKVIDAFEKLASSHEIVIVEGIGGIMTPISKNYFVSDLISELGMRTIIVTSSKIGTVNHSILTIEHAKNKNLELMGFVINQTDPEGYELSNLKQQLIDLTGMNVYATIPHLTPFDLDSYVKNFSNLVKISNFGFKDI
jgi:dethiobiotin synthetase